MELRSFLGALQQLTIDDVFALSLDIDSMTATTAEEIDVTRALLHIESALRRQHRVREAALVGHRASEIVLEVARRAAVELPEMRITRVARWADTVARGIVADDEAVHDLEVFCHGCDHIDVLAAIAV